MRTLKGGFLLAESFCPEETEKLHGGGSVHNYRCFMFMRT